LPAYMTEAASNSSDESSTKPTCLVFAIISSVHQKLNFLYYTMLARTHSHRSIHKLTF
jgi:hypothetical protein